MGHCALAMEAAGASLEQRRLPLAMPGSDRHRHLRTHRCIVPPATPRATLILVKACLNTSEGGHGNGFEALQVPHRRSERGSEIGANDLLKLFNDAQQNMLYLNKQRATAVENLDKVEREKKLLMARVAQLEAENQASSAECKVLQKKLQALEDEIDAQFKDGAWAIGGKGSKVKLNPVWSELTLMVDSLVLKGKIDLDEAARLRGLALNRDSRAAEVFSSLRNKGEKELIGGLLSLFDPNHRHSLHIVHICTEMAPLTKLGSYGHFVACLSSALHKKGNLVEIILPKYSSLDLKCVNNLVQLQTDFYSYFDGNWHNNRIWTGAINGVAFTLIDPLHPRGFFTRNQVYGCEDDFERFTYFSRAALDYILKAGKRPDILHIHNWQTAAVAPLFWDVFASQGLGQTRILFTLHNLNPQQLFEPHKLALCGLNPSQLHRTDRLQDNSETRCVNLLKGGIVYSNKVTTVSPVYANDLLTTELGQGQPTFLMHRNKFLGILNGVDESTWDPLKDQHLPFTFSSKDLSGKRKCKEEFLKRLGSPALESLKPLVGCVASHMLESELYTVEAALKFALSRQAQFVLVGGSDIPRVQTILENMKLSQKNLNCHIITDYDDELLHLAMAGSDILMCAAFLEPTYQTPLIAMKYGAIPVARAVCGSSGCVVDADDPNSKASERTGYTFTSPVKISDVMAALSRALDRYVNDPIGWKTLMVSGMRKDYSWENQCVKNYLAAYRSLQSL